MQQQLAAAAKTYQAQQKLRLASVYPLGLQQMQQQLLRIVHQKVWMVQQGQQQRRAGFCACWRCTWTAALTWT
jgi:hypothetical protein